MANYIDSKKLEISYLRHLGLFQYPCTSTITWPSLFLMQENVENEIVVRSISGNEYLELDYYMENKGEIERFHYKVDLAKAKANFGGFRYYFICPLIDKGKPCNKRVGILYRPEGEAYFGCRYCYKIIYITQAYNQMHSMHQEAKRFAIEKKLRMLENGREIYAGKKTHKLLKAEALQKEAEKYPSIFL